MRKTLIIIGNGFDLAHGLKTSYSHFIEYLVEEHYKNGTFSDIFDFPSQEYNYDDFKEELIEQRMESIRLNYSYFNNSFIATLLYANALENWNDIESFYFEELNKCKKNNTLDPKQLNDNFDIVKKHLSNYLLNEEKECKKINGYEHFFSSLDLHSTLILNFNYTRTLKQHYANSIKNSQHIHIHGELENEENPMIFGYAATHKESRELLAQNNVEYMKNIKKHLYKRTSNENEFLKFLNTKNTKIDVLILGHSCGLSDNLILNEIFNHQNIDSIRIFFHGDDKHYFELQVNIDRIMANDKQFKKLIPFKKDCFMLQHDDGEINQEKFVDFGKKLRTIISKDNIDIASYFPH